MISWSDALLALCFWVVTFYLFRPSALREQAWSDRRSFAPRLLALCLAVSLSFQVDPLAAAFDSLVGLRNLSWLLAYLNAVAAAYAGVLTLVVMGQRKMPQSVNILTVATLLALMVFFTALMRSGEELHNHFPTSASALGFREILYVSLALQLIFAIRIQWGLLEREELPIPLLE